MIVVTVVPVPVFGDWGYQIPSEAAIQAGVAADWPTAIPGFVVSTTPPTAGTAAPPQCQLIVSHTEIID